MKNDSFIISLYISKQQCLILRRIHKTRIKKNFNGLSIRVLEYAYRTHIILREGQNDAQVNPKIFSYRFKIILI